MLLVVYCAFTRITGILQTHDERFPIFQLASPSLSSHSIPRCGCPGAMTAPAATRSVRPRSPSRALFLPPSSPTHGSASQPLHAGNSQTKGLAPTAATIRSWPGSGARTARWLASSATRTSPGAASSCSDSPRRMATQGRPLARDLEGLWRSLRLLVHQALGVRTLHRLRHRAGDPPLRPVHSLHVGRRHCCFPVHLARFALASTGGIAHRRHRPRLYPLTDGFPRILPQARPQSPQAHPPLKPSTASRTAIATLLFTPLVPLLAHSLLVLLDFRLSPAAWSMVCADSTIYYLVRWADWQKRLGEARGRGGGGAGAQGRRQVAGEP